MSDDAHELVRRAKNGDRGALDKLIEMNLDRVYTFVALKLGPYDAAVEDVVQEALVAGATSIHRFRGETEAELLSWLLGISRFKIADHYRARYAAPTDALGSVAEADLRDPTPSPEDVVARSMGDTALREALSRLTPDQEEVLTLRFILGYGAEEIARMTGRNAGAVRALQFRGLAALRVELGSDREAWN